MEDVVVYARAYLLIECTDYRKVWYNLFICPNSSEWPNILQLCQLAFSLPFSNARVELKIIKRNSLNITTLDDLIEIYVDFVLFMGLVCSWKTVLLAEDHIKICEKKCSLSTTSSKD